MNRASPLSHVRPELTRAPRVIADKWPRRDTLLFAIAASAGLWTATYWLVLQIL